MEQLRAFVYDRTSRDIKGTAGERANADQNTENERFCERQGWAIVDRFTDPGKGASRHSKSKRTDYERMLDGIARGQCDVLVVWEASRAYRDLAVYVTLRDLCTKHRVVLCYNGQVYDMARGNDRFITGLNALQAELEADNIRERNLRTTRLNAERGGPHGRVPYGYRRIYDEHTGELVEQVPHEEQARVIKEIAKRVASGQSLYKVAQSLNERAIPAPTGGAWNPCNLPALITKATYIGKRVHQGVVIGDATWKGILDEDTYWACVRLFADPARRRVMDNSVKHLLVGLSRCALCKSGLRAQPSRTSPERSYACMVCFKVSVQAAAFEAIVVAAVLARIEAPGFAQALVADPEMDGTRAALAEAQALEVQLAEARELAGRWENGRMALSAVSLAKMEQELLPRIEDARGRAQSASVPVALREVAGPGARERWEAMESDLVWRRNVIRSVVVPWLNPAGKGVRTIKPGRYRLEWLY